MKQVIKIMVGSGLILAAIFIVIAGKEEDKYNRGTNQAEQSCSDLNKNCLAIKLISPRIINWQNSYNCRAEILIENYTLLDYSKFSNNIQSKRIPEFNKICQIVIVIYDDKMSNFKKDTVSKNYIQLSLYDGKNKVNEENIDF